MKRWLRGDTPAAPVLLRVHEPCGRAADSVKVDAVWYPSGRRATRQHRTAQGLCMIPWMVDQKRVELTVRTDEGASRTSAERLDPASRMVETVHLTAERQRRAG